ncbi:MAG TPA: HEAT repeat domain-containing protein [Lacisediminihabitans sp.]|uniref:HEAT repeat domain-containing protein n=1 Tax=Lacisediminihabitans sp. TaxID=2787631 RepID=UPI002ED7CF96
MNREPSSPVEIDDSPSDRIAAAVARFGEETVARRAASLLLGDNEGDEFLLYVGGRHAQGVLDGAPPLYWPEVWGARALTYAWDPSAASAVHRGLGDQAWRVREMCARVCFLRALPETEALVTLLTDEVARVRSAAARALGEVGNRDQLAALATLLQDPEKEVRRAGHDAMVRLEKRPA